MIIILCNSHIFTLSRPVKLATQDDFRERARDVDPVTAKKNLRLPRYPCPTDLLNFSKIVLRGAY